MDSKLEQLGKILRFSEEDLVENRKGVLSRKQKHSVNNSAWTFLFVFALGGLFFTWVIIFYDETSVNSGRVFIGVFLGVAMLAVGAFLFWLQSSDANQGAVKCLEGHVRFIPVRYGFALCVGDEQLPVTLNIPMLFDENTRYKIYYMPRDRKIVSLEKA